MSASSKPLPVLEAFKYPPLLTADGKNIVPGRTYLVTSHYDSDGSRTVTLLCTSVDLRQWFWIGRKAGESAETRYRHSALSDRSVVYASRLGLYRKLLAKAKEQLKKAQKDMFPSQYDRNNLRDARRRVQKLSKQAK